MPTHRWEYQILVKSTTEPPVGELNRQGEDGWEVVAAVGVGELGAVEEIWYLLKREMPEERR